MIIGKRQKLKAKRVTQNGMYFVDDEENEVLLPKNEAIEGANIGDIAELFVYKDSEDRIIATTKEPLIELGQIKKLRVVATTKIGAFMDWGLQKDLFLPFKEQVGMVQSHRSYLVGLYLDKSERLCATMKVYNYLSNKATYKMGERVCATVYFVDRDKGALVALEDKYYGFIPKQEMIGRIEPGDSLEVRIVFKREDGKYNVSIRKPMMAKRKDDANELLRLLKEWDGELLVTEKDSPQKIRRLCAMSKAEFKRAIGKLLKEKKIIKKPDGSIRKA